MCAAALWSQGARGMARTTCESGQKRVRAALSKFVCLLLSAEHEIFFFKRLAKHRQSASAGNRTRVTSMATMYSTTRPLMQLVKLASGHNICTDKPTLGEVFLRPISPCLQFFVAGEDRIQDLRIMRPTRYQLRFCHNCTKCCS